MRALREDVSCLQEQDHQPPRSGEQGSQEGILVTPRETPRDSTERIPGTSWDTIDPILEGDPSDSAHVVEESPRTEACIKASFHSMPNGVRRSLRSQFMLAKVASTISLRVDKVFAELCLKSTKQADKTLARLQALTLDAVGRCLRHWR